MGKCQLPVWLKMGEEKIKYYLIKFYRTFSHEIPASHPILEESTLIKFHQQIEDFLYIRLSAGECD